MHSMQSSQTDSMDSRTLSTVAPVAVPIATTTMTSLFSQEVPVGRLFTRCRETMLLTEGLRQTIFGPIWAQLSWQEISFDTIRIEGNNGNFTIAEIRLAQGVPEPSSLPRRGWVDSQSPLGFAFLSAYNFQTTCLSRQGGILGQRFKPSSRFRHEIFLEPDRTKVKDRGRPESHDHLGPAIRTGFHYYPNCCLRCCEAIRGDARSNGGQMVRWMSRRRRA